uniref:Uncharacterized protein n=1 Tax=Podarcis muralis TaxID=64176 RepID=A0A670J9R1_PODMU
MPTIPSHPPQFPKSGIMDRLTKVLVALYEEPEKPSCALDFMKHHLGAAAPENPEVEMKEKYELAQYEPPQEEKRGE